ncbi:hypothetical protein ILUMI_13041 [Ignelater luminosus]|uniref:Uncharacterized protein n=1 Tax=Ignelater luminosus TaxID=2038154 RepID=A0A8K0GB85_IGNLU|nr:hypothetical protein ILUMI_13041 [Ignelater luminosus]
MGGLVDDLLGRQLQAGAEAVFFSGRRLGEYYFDEEDDIPVSLLVYSRAQKGRVGIPRPNVIAQYNNFMEKTDQMDANVGTYRIDVCVQNSWILMKNTGNNISQLNFRREIAQNYFVKYGVPPRGAGRPSSYSESSRVFLDLRYDQ